MIRLISQENQPPPPGPGTVGSYPVEPQNSGGRGSRHNCWEAPFLDLARPGLAEARVKNQGSLEKDTLGYPGSADGNTGDPFEVGGGTERFIGVS